MRIDEDREEHNREGTRGEASLSLGANRRGAEDGERELFVGATHRGTTTTLGMTLPAYAS